MIDFAPARLLQSSIKHTGCENTVTFGGSRARDERTEADVKVISSKVIKTTQYVLYDGNDFVGWMKDIKHRLIPQEVLQNIPTLK